MDTEAVKAAAQRSNQIDSVKRRWVKKKAIYRFAFLRFPAMKCQKNS